MKANKQLVSRIIINALGVLAASLVLAGCKTGNVSFNKPSDGFEPRRVYSTTFDKAWQAVNQALDANHIAVASSDKADGRIQTDYIQGESMVMGLGSSADSRYNYNIKLFPEEGGKIRVSVIAKLEMMISHDTGGGAYKDVTQLNQAGVVKNLENWLYEQIERGLQ